DCGVWLLASRRARMEPSPFATKRTGAAKKRGRVERGATVDRRSRQAGNTAPAAPVLVASDTAAGSQLVIQLTGLALGIAGFAAMGMEIVWFRHFTILLGGFRAV